MKLYALRGSHTNYLTDEAAFYAALFGQDFWFYSECHDGGKQLFNLDFLGKWRTVTEEQKQTLERAREWRRNKL